MRIRSFGAIVGNAPEMEQVYKTIRRAAAVDMPVLITGPTGTGKELVAQEVHKRSRRSRGHFITVHTGALTPELVISELFGHVKGAFTGAVSNKTGRFEEANDGTLFLDEVTTMEPRVQVALLRVLETGAFRPVGARNNKNTNARLIAATNTDLDQAVAQDQFRADLMHRLQVLRVDLPPLQLRPGDIPMLVRHFLNEIQHDYGVSIDRVTPEALEALTSFPWPGNVRELKNVMAQSAVLADTGVIDVDQLPNRVTGGPAPAAGPDTYVEEAPSAPAWTSNDHEPRDGTPEPATVHHGATTQEGVFFPLGTSLEEVQKAYALKTLQYCGNNKTRAARILKVSRKTLYDKLMRWGVKEKLTSGAEPPDGRV
ncbi:MAG: sigma-54 interaction domain-containing protein [Candidatus Hydrogenedentota bacterium]